MVFSRFTPHQEALPYALNRAPACHQRPWVQHLITGESNRTAIGTLVERSTRFLLLRDAILASIATLPAQLRKSLTWDQSKEMAQAS